MNKIFLGVVGVVLLSGGALGIRTATQSASLEVEEIPVPSATPIAEKSFTLMAVGDVMLGRSVNIGSIERADFNWPFRETAHRLQRVDLTIGNLETPIVDECRQTHLGTRFCADPRSVAGLVFAGFDVMNLSNNHALDYGTIGRDETLEILRSRNIAGVYEDIWWQGEVNGLTVAIMGFNDVEGVLDREKLVRQVEQVKQADRETIVIAMVHWGGEYMNEPTERQKTLGRAMVDAGVDIVIGSHPHWTQPVEPYKGKLIFYSLGNFIFDQMWSSETRKGESAHITVTAWGDNEPSLAYELLPLTIYDYGQARWD